MLALSCRAPAACRVAGRHCKATPCARLPAPSPARALIAVRAPQQPLAARPQQQQQPPARATATCAAAAPFATYFAAASWARWSAVALLTYLAYW